MPDLFLKFDGEIDRRSPADELAANSPRLRENWLARDGVLRKPPGTEKAITTILDGTPRWIGRYYTNEVGQGSPKTFAYTDDGSLYVVNTITKLATTTRTDLNTNAFPRHWLFKTAAQTKMYLVDNRDMYEYDGNNDNTVTKVALGDADGNPINPIDVIEHKDRLVLISKTDLYISALLDPTNFSNPFDSLHIIVGSGKGKNLALGRIEGKLYIFNTEGIFVVIGDVISALAITFEIRLVDERKILAGRTAVKVEKAILFIAEDRELWSWDGNTSTLLTFKYKMKDFVEQIRDKLDKATAGWFNNYYMVSFVEKGAVEPNYEIWWDSFTGRVDVVRGRNVSCFGQIDPTEETEFLLLGRSDSNTIMWANRTVNFDGVAIRSSLKGIDATVAKGENVRFLEFHPEFESTGNRNLLITYLLDGRSSPPTGAPSSWQQNLRGETKTVGSLAVTNQNQFIDRIRPKINSARGSSIAFEIIDETKNLQAGFIGMGISFVKKGRKKGKAIGR